MGAVARGVSRHTHDRGRRFQPGSRCVRLVRHPSRPTVSTDELRRNDLQVVTDVTVVEAGLHDGNLVDHIAVTSRLIWGGSVMRVMGLRDSDGIRLSDHPTVIVELLMLSADNQPAADAGV